MCTFDDFVKGLEILLPRMIVKIEEDKIKLSRNLPYNNHTFCELNIKDIQEIIDLLSGLTMSAEFILSSDEYFEIPVKAQDPLRMLSYRYIDNNEFLEERFSYRFNISKISPKYLVALICRFSNADSDIRIDTTMFRHRMLHADTISSVDRLCETMNIITVQISSPSPCTSTEFMNLYKSYIFNVAYVNNIVFTTSNLLESPRNRRNGINRNGQLFPYKKHNEELLKYYYQGLSTDIPFAQYLAFYHVAEFFFQTIAEDDAFQLIEKLITHPSFSPHRKKDIQQFYKKIKKKMSDQNDEGVWKEKVGLRLCLEKYIPDTEILKNSIIALDSNAISYYNSNDVPFASEGTDNSIRINFEDTSSVYANICNRVYLVRNAIAHSKEGEHLRYEPFSHDAELSKEIPLIRAIAEEIIINSAKDLPIKYGEQQ